jgi:hypothetical protein
LSNLYVCLLFLTAASVLPARADALSAPVQFAHCDFHRDGDHFSGSCGPLFGQSPGMTLRSVVKVSSGAWRSDVTPLSAWAGDMTDEGYPNEPLELEVYSAGRGVLRTEYGWFPVTNFMAGPALAFTFGTVA